MIRTHILPRKRPYGANGISMGCSGNLRRPREEMLLDCLRALPGAYLGTSKWSGLFWVTRWSFRSRQNWLVVDAIGRVYRVIGALQSLQTIFRNCIATRFSSEQTVSGFDISQSLAKMCALSNDGPAYCFIERENLCRERARRDSRTRRTFKSDCPSGRSGWSLLSMEHSMLDSFGQNCPIFSCSASQKHYPV
jgi:hypothetical protein